MRREIFGGALDYSCRPEQETRPITLYRKMQVRGNALLECGRQLRIISLLQLSYGWWFTLGVGTYPPHVTPGCSSLNHLSRARLL